MLEVMIVGDGDSGKTTFLGLLYATQVRSGSEKADSFRFHAPPESLEAIALVFQQLMSGSFPDSVAKQGLNEISFQLSPLRKGLGILLRLRGKGSDRSPFSTVHFTVLRTRVEEFSRVLMGGSVVDRKANSIYGSDAVVILVDSTKLGMEVNHAEPWPLSRYDGGVETLLTMIQRLGDPDGHRRLHPIFIFTKFDRVRPDVLRASNVAAEPPKVDEIHPRAAYAERLLDCNLPRTLATVKARRSGGVRFAGSAYFFSWVRTEEPIPGQPERIRLRRSENAGWEPEYSNNEYRAFMGYLGDIAVRSEG